MQGGAVLARACTALWLSCLAAAASAQTFEGRLRSDLVGSAILAKMAGDLCVQRHPRLQAPFADAVDQLQRAHGPDIAAGWATLQSALGRTGRSLDELGGSLRSQLAGASEQQCLELLATITASTGRSRLELMQADVDATRTRMEQRQRLRCDALDESVRELAVRFLRSAGEGRRIPLWLAENDPAFAIDLDRVAPAANNCRQLQEAAAAEGLRMTGPSQPLVDTLAALRDAIRPPPPATPWAVAIDKAVELSRRFIAGAHSSRP